MRKRRRATQEALAAEAVGANAAMRSQSSCPADPPLPKPLSWTDKHEKELQFQQAKLHRRRVEAAADNLMLCGEGNIAQLRHGAANIRQDQVNSERARLARTRRITAALSGQTPEGVLAAIRHKQVYVFNECMNETLASSLETACLVQGDDMATADVFVMKNPGYGQAGAMLVSALKGCYQISPGLLLSKGHAVKFKPRMQQPRILFASKKFANKHHEFCNCVDRTVEADPAAECKMKFEIQPKRR